MSGVRQAGTSSSPAAAVASPDASNPQIVHVCISPFGSDGPAALRPANDLTLSALGGQASLQGSPERAPVRVTSPQVWRHTGAQAAAAALIAHARRVRTGAGHPMRLRP